MTLEQGSAAIVGRSRELSYPAGVSDRRVNVRYALAVGGYHLLALLAFMPWFFSWTGVALAVAGIYVCGLFGINLCYHRLLSHRSFSCPLWLEHGFAMLGIISLEDAPARWVAAHRLHHHRADDQPDPHSPLVNWFWAYMGWLFVDNADLSRLSAYDRYARDITRDRFYVWAERAYGWIVLGQWVVCFATGFLIALAIGWTSGEAFQFGASIWLWGVVVRTIGVWHVTWCGNSFPHLFGYRNYETQDNSRNNVWVAMLTSGEGWHNNHHADPNSASNQHRWWEFDLTYQVLRLLVLVGLAWDVKVPAPQPAPAAIVSE